jgi:hypothetical protein
MLVPKMSEELNDFKYIGATDNQLLQALKLVSCDGRSEGASSEINGFKLSTDGLTLVKYVFLQRKSDKIQPLISPLNAAEMHWMVWRWLRSAPAKEDYLNPEPPSSSDGTYEPGFLVTTSVGDFSRMHELCTIKPVWIFYGK